MHPIIINILFILSGFICLIFGAEGLVRGGRSIGIRLGLTPLFIGLTIVACGTSAPELVVSISAALQGKGDISVGNVVGSNIFNILGILGVTSLITPLFAPGISTVDISAMMLAAVVLLPLAWTGMKIARWEGAFLVAGYGVYLCGGCGPNNARLGG